jgi:uncharacterized protein (DUF1330 family)
MAVFVVSRVKINDAAAMADYFEQAPATVAAFGGEYQVRTNEIASLEGEWAHDRMVVLKFPDAGQAHAWYDSPAYLPLRDLRQRSADAQIVMVPGEEA